MCSPTHDPVTMFMFMFHLMATSVQVQGWFRFNDVKHILSTGVSHGGSSYQNDLTGTRGVIHTTDIPKHVVLCMTKTGTHGFLHNESAICRCFWEKRAKMSLVQKIEVVKHLLLWLDGKKSSKHCLSKEEDARIFDMAKTALGMHAGGEDTVQS